jgi:hypothetical protein
LTTLRKPDHSRSPICWVEDFIRRIKTDNLVVVPNRPMIPVIGNRLIVAESEQESPMPSCEHAFFNTFIPVRIKIWGNGAGQIRILMVCSTMIRDLAKQKKVH